MPRATGVSAAVDCPFYDVVEQAIPLMERGANVYQKFTCDGCGSRQMMSEPNKFFTTGICEECGHVTDISAKGCGFLVHFYRR